MWTSPLQTRVLRYIWHLVCRRSAVSGTGAPGPRQTDGGGGRWNPRSRPHRNGLTYTSTAGRKVRVLDYTPNDTLLGRTSQLARTAKFTASGTETRCHVAKTATWRRGKKGGLAGEFGGLAHTHRHAGTHSTVRNRMTELAWGNYGTETRHGTEQSIDETGTETARRNCNTPDKDTDRLWGEGRLEIGH
jgi:hypothetical protein